MDPDTPSSPPVTPTGRTLRPRWRSSSCLGPESVALLTGRLPNLSPESADRVAEALGDLPLALEQAVGLLRDTGMPVPDYLAPLYAQARRVLGHRADPVGRDRTVAASWTVAFDRLAAETRRRCCC